MARGDAAGGGFGVEVFEDGGLARAFEFLFGVEAGGGGHLVIGGGVAGEVEGGVGEGEVVAFRGEEAAEGVFDGFGDAAVPGGEDGETAGHGFEHGVGDALAVAVGGGFAGVEEDVSGFGETAEIGSVEEAWEGDAVGDAEGGGFAGEIGAHGAVAGEGESGGGELRGEGGEGAEGSEEAFFGDEAAGLEEVPCAVGGDGAGGERPVVEGDAGALEAEFVGGAACGLEVVEEGLGASEDEGGAVEDRGEGALVCGVVHFDAGVSAVEGDDDGARAGAEERAEEDGDVAEEDVDDGGFGAEDGVEEETDAGWGDGEGFATDVFPPPAAEVFVREGWEDGEAFGVEGEACGFGAFLGDDGGLPVVEGHDLAMDMLHVRFEEILTVTSHDRHGG